jgi:hypothetical protein
LLSLTPREEDVFLDAREPVAVDRGDGAKPLVVELDVEQLAHADAVVVAVDLDPSRRQLELEVAIAAGLCQSAVAVAVRGVRTGPPASPQTVTVTAWPPGRG